CACGRACPGLETSLRESQRSGWSRYDCLSGRNLRIPRVNGAGKTTAIRLLMGIIKADDGVLEILGEKTRRTTIQQKQSIGYVSQEQTFYPWMTARGLGRFVGGFYPKWDEQEFERL